MTKLFRRIGDYLSELKEKYFNEDKGFFRSFRLFINDLIKRPMLKAASIVAAGSIVAQGINIIFSPIISRFYSPDMFGTLGFIISATSVLTPLAMLCYSYAIILPKEDKDSVLLIRFSIVSGVVFSLLIFVVLLILNEPLARIFNVSEYREYLLLIPLMLVITIIIITYDTWLIRKKIFKTSSIISASQSLLMNLSLLGVGFYYPIHTSLIGINLFAKAYHALASFITTRKSIKQTMVDGQNSRGGNLKRLKLVLREYRDFPIYRTPQIVLSSLSSNLPVLMLTILSGTNATGLYDLARRVLNLPVIVVADSIGKVFEQRVAEKAQSGQSVQTFTLKAVLLLAAVGAIPFAILFFFGPVLFEFVFGPEWYGAGVYARWMSLWLFTVFTNRPCIKAIPSLDLQKQYLVFEIFSVLIRGSSLVAAFLVTNNDVIGISAFSIAGAALNIVLMIYVLIKSAERNRYDNEQSIDE